MLFTEPICQKPCLQLSSVTVYFVCCNLRFYSWIFCFCLIMSLSLDLHIQLFSSDCIYCLLPHYSISFLIWHDSLSGAKSSLWKIFAVRGLHSLSHREVGILCKGQASIASIMNLHFESCPRALTLPHFHFSTVKNYHASLPWQIQHLFLADWSMFPTDILVRVLCGSNDITVRLKGSRLCFRQQLSVEHHCHSTNRHWTVPPSLIVFIRYIYWTTVLYWLSPVLPPKNSA